uniref:ParB/Sulfiredoxin domain-containing protein n=1 Tax=viral metagenome TaxID=1070528 RepID=A0A6C0D6I4_9ZZZZ
MLHTFLDKSVLQKIKAKELIGIPVWRGNRFIDLDHADKIKSAIGNKPETLDSTIFRVVKYKDGDIQQKYLVDGQHRQYVIKKYYEEQYILPINFDVLVHEKTVESEADAIEYFNAINNTKPQQDNDPKILANKYILALEKHFVKLIRPEGKNTKRPFLSNDLLRKVLEENATMLKQSNEFVKRFIERVDTWNKKKIPEYELSLFEKKDSILQSCIDKKFVLAFDARLPWIKECLVF